MPSNAFTPQQRQAIRFVRSKAFEVWVDSPQVIEAFRNYFSAYNPGFTKNHWVFASKGASLTLSDQGLDIEPTDIPELREAYLRAGSVEGVTIQEPNEDFTTT